MNKKEFKKEIKYWTKHQELDKFNYSFSFTLHLSFLALILAIAYPFLVHYATQNLLAPLVFLSLLVITLYSSTLIHMLFSAREHKRNFRIRDSILKIGYKKYGVNTNKLEEIFENVKQKYRSKMTENQLENISEKEMEKYKPLEE